MLLNEGQIFGNQVLSSETVDMMFQNHIGNLDFSPGDLDFSSMDFAFGEKAKWGLGFMLHPEGTKNGRNKNSVSWLGLFNSYFWVDREAGIYGVFASQLLPTFDKKFVKHLISFEKEIYNSSRHGTNN
jgi:CubicO group peptidase (beta-lactamase class C family)